MLNVENAAVIAIDYQEKLVRAMHDKGALVHNAARLVQGARILRLPILWTEQNPQGLGPTVGEIARHLSDLSPIIKLSFSCCGEQKFLEPLEDLHRKQFIVGGIESHVCVYQTVMDLVHMGYEVQVLADAVSSRTPENKAIGLQRCKEVGAAVSSVETVLFELLKVADGDRFKQMLKVVK